MRRLHRLNTSTTPSVGQLTLGGGVNFSAPCFPVYKMGINLGMVAYIVNLITWELQTGKSGVQSQLQIPSEFKKSYAT